MEDNQDEIKKGSRNSSKDKQTILEIRDLAGKIHDHTITLQPEDTPDEEPTPEEEPTADSPEDSGDSGGSDKSLIVFGDTLKALGENRFGGYLVRFSSENDPDLTGDFFTAETDFGPAEKSAGYFNHRLPVYGPGGKVADAYKSTLGEVSLKKDKIGQWAEIILQARNEYEQAILSLAKSGKLGWSSGTASHLVEREPAGKAFKITSWPLGADASLTPTPAEPRNKAIPLKSIVTNVDIPTKNIEMETPTMAENDSKNYDDLAAKYAELEKSFQRLVDIEEAIAKMEPVLKQSPAVANYNKTGLGDTPTKAFAYWCKTGFIPDGLREETIKLANSWNETTAGDGGVVVPTETYAEINRLVAEQSVMRQAGARVIQTSRAKVTLPKENEAMAVFTSTAEENNSDESQTTPFAGKDLAVVKYTRHVLVSNELLSDSIVAIEPFINSQFANAQALTENNVFMVGSGDGDPAIEGIFVGGTAGSTLGSASTITKGEPDTLLYKLPSGYSDNAHWFARWATFGTVYSIRDSNFYLYQNTPQGVTGQGLLGRPIHYTDQIAAMAASAKSICVGDPRQYTIVENPVMFVRRNPYLYDKTDQTAFFAKIRIGGGVMQATAFQYATHPTA